MKKKTKNGVTRKTLSFNKDKNFTETPAIRSVP